jgi:apolipoprotein N-acyltransferase
LTIITNDGWYGKSAGPRQHNRFAVLRAIENRRWIARSANTGISSIIDDRGRMVKETPLFVPGSITADIPRLTRKTFYSRYGDFIAIPAMWISVFVGVFGILSFMLERSQKRKVT